MGKANNKRGGGEGGVRAEAGKTGDEAIQALRMADEAMQRLLKLASERKLDVENPIWNAIEAIEHARQSAKRACEAVVRADEAN